MNVVRASARVTNATGLHARPAVKLTRLAKTFEATVRLRPEGATGWTDAKSVVRTMALKARTGTLLDLEAEGADAERAVAALVALIQRSFDEGDGVQAHG